MNIKTKKLWMHQVLLIQLLFLYTGAIKLNLSWKQMQSSQIFALIRLTLFNMLRNSEFFKITASEFIRSSIPSLIKSILVSLA